MNFDFLIKRLVSSFADTAYFEGFHIFHLSRGSLSWDVGCEPCLCLFQKSLHIDCPFFSFQEHRMIARKWNSKAATGDAGD